MEDKIEEEVMSDEKQLMNGSTALALANFYATRVEDNFRKKLP